MPYSFPNLLWQTLVQTAGFTDAPPASALKIPYRDVAGAIQRQSDFYIEKPDGQTPWSEKWCQWAQLLYYFPLNYLRSQRIIEQAVSEGFFSDVSDIWEFGAGLSPTLRALRDAGVTQKAFLTESSKVAQNLAEKIHQNSAHQNSDQQGSSLSWSKSFEPTKKSLAVFSYALTELEQLPKAAMNAHALLIIEPSTHQDGRRLLELRKQLIEAGYYIWAPCVHQLNCPLKEESVKDWCHDRIHIEMPKEFQQIGTHLPFKNNTITMSYLLAKKTPPKSLSKSNTARVVGDYLAEKGKVRQMICRGLDREFLTCLTRNEAQPIEFARGDLIEIVNESGLQKIGKNELRYSDSNVLKLVVNAPK